MFYLFLLIQQIPKKIIKISVHPQMAQNTLKKLFLYGTLKRGEPNYHWLTNPNHGVAKYLCEARSTVKMPLIISTKFNIPFLLNFPGVGHFIKGEIYEVDDKMLSKLDILEDYPALYDRDVRKFCCNDSNEVVDCIVYFLKFKPEKLSQKLMLLEEYKDKVGMRYVSDELEDYINYQELYEEISE